MNLAALIQQQSLAVLLSAIETAPVLKAGETVQAKLVSINPDGTARALVAGSLIDLVLSGASARQPNVVPGALLQLRIDQPPGSAQGSGQGIGQAARALLLDVVAPQTSTALGNTRQPPQAADVPLTATSLAQNTTAARALAGPLLAQAVSRQDSLAPLYATIATLPQAKVDGLGGPVPTAVARLLAQRLPGEGAPITALELKQAVASSGLFHEAQLANGNGQTAQGDLKTTLLALKSALQAFATPDGETDALPEQQTQIRNGLAQTSGAARPPLPRHDGQPVAQGIAQSALPPDATSSQVHKVLAQQTEAALDRLKLSQYASLPPLQDPARIDASAAQRWFSEVPLAFAQGTAVLPFEIERDPPKPGARAGEAPVWRVRFALDGEPLGPLQALVTMQGKAVNVSVWATREDTTKLLRAAAPDLREALMHEAFERAELEIFTGAPAQPKAAAGQFLDRRS